MAAFRQVDQAIQSLCSRNVAVALKAIQAATGKRIAHLLNVTESTVSDFKSEDLEKAMQVISAAGLKVVPADEITKSPDELRNLLRISIKHTERELAELDRKVGL
jgi:hypothetical protein